MLLRALIVLLLILNLGVALWWSTRGDAPAAPAPTLPAGAEPLRLLAEEAPTPPSTPDPVPAPGPAAAGLPDVPPPPAAAQEPAATAAAEATVCRSFGPFDDAAAAAQAQARLAPLARRLATRQVRPDARGWQVLLRGMPDRDAAAATASRLVAAGFRDHYLMPTADNGQVDIALGRFGGEAAAQRHREALVAAGFGAVAEPLGDPGATRYWIDAALGAEVDPAAAQRASGAARSEPRECEAPAAG